MLIKYIYTCLIEKCKSFTLKLSITFANTLGAFDKCVEYYEKAKAKTGDFDIMFLIGNVFAKNKQINLTEELLKISQTVPIYILGINNDNHHESIDISPIGIVHKHRSSDIIPIEIKKNIFLLGRCGVIEVKGVKIGYLNGLENKMYLDNQRYKYTGEYFDIDDFNRLNDYMNSYRDLIGIDILLLNCIPSPLYNEIMYSFFLYIRNSDILNDLVFDKKVFKDSESVCSSILVEKLNPRYLITGTDEDFFFERMPYLNSKNYPTRFIHISNVPCILTLSSQ